MVLGGDTLSTEAIQKLYTRIEEENFHVSQGFEKKYDIANDYIEAIKNHIHLKRPMKIVIDCGNGVAGAYARKIYESIGCSVEELFCDVDGTFPNHHPDPSEPHNLNDVITHLKKSEAELGFAFDGDADRLGVVTKDGQIIYPDRQLLLFAEDVLSRNPNATIIFDVKSTRNLFQWIKDKGGKPLMWKTGHSLIKAKMKEENAALAGEMSGHTFFKERWYGFDDGIYAGVRLLEILSRFDNPSEVLNNLPNSISTPELQIKMKEGEPHVLIKKLQTEAEFDNALEIIKVDGLRVEYQDGFGLMRASNTTPVIVLRFEAENKVALERIQQSFKEVLLKASPESKLPF
jgi:phosphomannomutase/phosphoglucomutase